MRLASGGRAAPTPAPGVQPANRREPATRRVARTGKSRWYPDIRPGLRNLKSRVHDADDDGGVTIQGDRLPEHVVHAGEQPAPHTLTDDHYGFKIVGRCQSPADCQGSLDVSKNEPDTNATSMSSEVTPPANAATPGE